MISRDGCGIYPIWDNKNVFIFLSRNENIIITFCVSIFVLPPAFRCAEQKRGKALFDIKKIENIKTFYVFYGSHEAQVFAFNFFINLEASSYWYFCRTSLGWLTSFSEIYIRQLKHDMNLVQRVFIFVTCALLAAFLLFRNNKSDPHKNEVCFGVSHSFFNFEILTSVRKRRR